jgi:hypothetical protein
MISQNQKIKFLDKDCITDETDASGNSAPPGFLWLRKINKIEGIKVNAIIQETFIDNNIQRVPIGEVIGFISIFHEIKYHLYELNTVLTFHPFQSDDEIVQYYFAKICKSPFRKLINKTFGI